MPQLWLPELYEALEGRKSICGLKDAARVWYEAVVRVVTETQTGPDIICVEEKRERIIGIMVMHAVDLCFGGGEEFYRDIIGRMKKKLKIGEENE